MKPQLWAVMLLLAIVPAHAGIVVNSFAWTMRQGSDEILEGTVLAARLLTYQSDGETRVCGASYDVVADDFIPGHAPRHLTLGMYFRADANRIRALDSGHGLSLGRTYFFGISRNAVQRMTLDKLVRYASGNDKPHPEIRACMGKLPHDFVSSPLEIMGPPDNPSQQYVRIHATQAVDDADIQGKYKESYTPSKPAPPSTATIETITSADLEMQELDYDQRVSLDALKHMFGLGGSTKAAEP